MIDKITNFQSELPDVQRFSQANTKSNENIEAIKKLSDEFEGIFLEIVLKSMRETVDKSQLTDGGNGEQIFQSMLDSEYAKNLASQRTTGLAASIEQQLLGMMVDTKSSAELSQKAKGLAEYGKAEAIPTHQVSRFLK